MLKSTMKKTILYICLALFLLLPLSRIIKPLLASNNLTEHSETVTEGGSNFEILGNQSFGNTVFDISLAIGMDPLNPGNETGALQTVGKYIAQTYELPASFQTYYADLKSNFLGKPAYAQVGGVGFNGLQSLLVIWKAFRNITYSLSAIIFVILGLMIMFRVKISPQAVLTVQSAIPKLITTLILITFSYAIAGLVIDFSYLLVALVLVALQSAGLSIGGQSIQDLTNAGLWDMFQLMYRALPANFLAFITVPIGAIIGGIVGMLATGGNPLGGAIGLVIGPALIGLVIAIIFLVWLIKFLFGLFGCYVKILLKVILAPIEIGVGAFPGQSGGFSNWLKGLIANVLVFPVSLLFMVLINAIIEATQQGLINGNPPWTPSLLHMGQTANGVAMGLSGGFVPVVVGLGGIMMLSKLPELIPQAVFQIKPSPFGAAIGQNVSGIYRPIQGVGRAAAGAGGTQAYGTLTNPGTIATGGRVGRAAAWVQSSPKRQAAAEFAARMLGGKTN